MNSSPESFRSFVVREAEDGVRGGQIEQRRVDDLPVGDVLVRVSHSSLNYKDAMAATGHPGVARSLPLTPGIDLVGVVAASDSPDFQRGDQVLATGYELGVTHDGGWSEYCRAPAEWVLPLPAGLTPRECMIYGTGGLTAAQCVLAIVEKGVKPADGEIVVTGATGGVGSFAVRFLHQLGYPVVAVTGKEVARDWLQELGAASVISRKEMERDPKRPLLSTRWAGAVDTVGGQTLTNIIRETAIDGCVSACGMVGGDKLDLTVFPFILRGVTLAGIGSAYCSRQRREQIWGLLADSWRPKNLEQGVQTVALDHLKPSVEQMLQGQHQGRTVIEL